jgi:hypothetical protein
VRLAIALLTLSAAALGAAAVSSRPAPLPEHTIANRPVTVADDGYTSSQACRACHPNEYATWRGSYHSTMTQVATPASVRANFAGVTVADVHGRPMRLGRDGDRFFAEFDDPDWSGEGAAPPRITRDVVMITGSHHQQIYWYATGQGRLLGQLPGAYLIREARWIPRRMAVLHPPTDPIFSETGHWNSTCIACHTTHGKPKFDTPFGSAPVHEQTVDTTVAEFGIACEACHGPSGDHARANRNPLRRYGLHASGAADVTTVQPQRLSPKAGAQVCGQCHGIWEFDSPAAERTANWDGLPYRPGAELTASRFLAQPTRNHGSDTMQRLLESDAGFLRDSFWSDGKVRVSGREYNGLLESPCFANAPTDARTLTCFSCHTMHQTAQPDRRPIAEWANDQLAPGMDGDAACTQCHEPIARDVPAHTKHGGGSAGSRCYNCHMPYTTYGLLKTIRSHTVSSPSAAESVDTGRPNACNLCHLDKTLAWTGDALERWYGMPRAALSDDQQQVAAALLWALRGDAGQRAIVAEAFGWSPAQQASGTDWMPPYLAELINDPYDAVRFIAGRSLRTLPAFSEFPYDFAAPASARYQSQLQAMGVWDRTRPRPGRTDASLLMTSAGSVNVDAFLRLLKERDNRRVLLRE